MLKFLNTATGTYLSASDSTTTREAIRQFIMTELGNLSGKKEKKMIEGPESRMYPWSSKKGLKDSVNRGKILTDLLPSFVTSLDQIDTL